MINTKCDEKNGWQVFSGSPQVISAGALGANVALANSAVETTLLSETVYGDTFSDSYVNFRVRITGAISSDGAKDVAFKLYFGSTALLTLTTVSLPDEDDKAFRLCFDGRIHTVGSSGKIVATGILQNEMTGMADVMDTTAIAGVSVNTTADASIKVTAKWDAAHADAEVDALTGVIEFFK